MNVYLLGIKASQHDIRGADTYVQGTGKFPASDDRHQFPDTKTHTSQPMEQIFLCMQGRYDAGSSGFHRRQFETGHGITVQ